MAVRCKFSVSYKKPEGEDGAAHIYLAPVYSGSEENKEFFRLTPGGVIQLSTVNPAAAAQFVQGKECYVDFTFPD